MPRGRKKKSEILAGDVISDNGIGPVDVHVGSRIAARRKLLQLSQTELADKLGITFQQVQKYEKGVNRIGAGRLYSIASILGVDISYFYNDIAADSYSQLFGVQQNYSGGFLQEDAVDQQFDPVNGAEATMLLKAFYALPPKARAALLTMLVNLREKYDEEGDA